MGDFNHGNIKWDSLQNTGVEDQRFLCLVQDNFLTQHVLELGLKRIYQVTNAIRIAIQGGEYDTYRRIHFFSEAKLGNG